MTRLTWLVASTALASLAALPSCAAETAASTMEEDLTRAECRGPRGETEQACRVEGVVQRQVERRFDLIGEACVTFVKVGARRYGLVFATDTCDTERFARGDVKVSFSKGALAAVGREQSQVLKEFEGGVTYYDLSGELRVHAPAPPRTVAEFDALLPLDKYDHLYEGDEVWADLREGFTENPIRIVVDLEGATKNKALAAYYQWRTHALDNGGDTPNVVAIQKDGVAWAYAIHSSGRSYGNWHETHVYDRSFQEIGGFGDSD